MTSFAYITNVKYLGKGSLVTFDFFFISNSSVNGTASIDVDLADISTKVATSEEFKNQLKPSLQAKIEEVSKQPMDSLIIL